MRAEVSVSYISLSNESAGGTSKEEAGTLREPLNIYSNESFFGSFVFCWMKFYLLLFPFEVREFVVTFFAVCQVSLPLSFPIMFAFRPATFALNRSFLAFRASAPGARYVRIISSIVSIVEFVIP